MNGYAVGFSNGFLSPNDIRRLENMDLIPAEQGGDDYYLNGSYTKLKDAGSAYGTNQVAEQEKQTAEDPPDEDQPNEKPMSRKAENVAPIATDEYAGAFWNMIRNQGDQFAVRNALSVGEDTEGGYTVPDEFERKLIQALEENNIFRQLVTVIRTNSGTRKIPIANDTMDAQWIDEGEEIPETNTKFGQTTLSAYRLN